MHEDSLKESVCNCHLQRRHQCLKAMQVLSNSLLLLNYFLLLFQAEAGNKTGKRFYFSRPNQATPGPLVEIGYLYYKCITPYSPYIEKKEKDIKVSQECCAQAPSLVNAYISCTFHIPAQNGILACS